MNDKIRQNIKQQNDKIDKVRQNIKQKNDKIEQMRQNIRKNSKTQTDSSKENEDTYTDDE